MRGLPSAPTTSAASAAERPGLVGRTAEPQHNGAGEAAGEILIAADLGPAEVAELDRVSPGSRLAAGGVSAHAAIVARSLGIPMVVGVGDDLLTAAPGSRWWSTETTGPCFCRRHPSGSRRRRWRSAGGARDARAGDRQPRASVGHRRRPPGTCTGERLGSGRAGAALEAGAEGVGLLRTELAFLDAPEWPSEDEHRRALAPILAQLQGRPATVRVLDFGGDKTPPFLAGIEQRGIALLLAYPDRLAAQLRAIVASAGTSELACCCRWSTVSTRSSSRGGDPDAVEAVPGGVAPHRGDDRNIRRS